MIVQRQPIDPGPPGWAAILPPRVPRSALDEPLTIDWLIIGGGFAGLAAARRLRQLHQTDTIAILEARQITDGPLGRNSGFMIDIPHNLTSGDYAGAVEEDIRQTLMNRAAITFAEQAALDYEMQDEAFVRCGKINSAATKRGQVHNQRFSAHLAALGEPHDMLDQADMAALTGTDYYLAGLFTPGAAMLQPGLYGRGMADGLERQHVRIFEHSPVVELQRVHGNWIARTPSGSISAPKVILAVNGHAESFGFFKRRLMHVFLFASMTRALSADEVRALGGEPRWGVTPSDPLGTTVRRISGIGGDRIVIRNDFSYRASRSVPARRVASAARIHRQVFDARFPMLKAVEMEHSWGGLLCLSRNAVSAFGEVEEGLFAACCQNGLGSAKGTLAGMLAAELASGIRSDHVTQMLAQDCPQRLPPEPFAAIGATAVMRWREFRAGREL